MDLALRGGKIQLRHESLLKIVLEGEFHGLSGLLKAVPKDFTLGIVHCRPDQGALQRGISEGLAGNLWRK